MLKNIVQLQDHRALAHHNHHRISGVEAGVTVGDLDAFTVGDADQQYVFTKPDLL